MKHVLILLFLLTPAAVVAAAIDPETYYEIEVRARELNIEGMEARLLCMQNGCDLQSQYAIDEEYQKRNILLHEEYDITPSQLAGWYTQNMEETEKYLLTSPNLQLQLEHLSFSYENLSDAITTLQEAQQ